MLTRPFLTLIEKVRELLNENRNMKALEEERDRLDKLKDAFNEAHRAYDEFIDNEEDRPLIYGTTSVTEIILK